ncbi:Type 1 glutamine amidotransferase-like domain-containing protein [Devosia geojensis]|nr:Type 1 glutamine amidotransferase-like domain-containing protein [Devosia geojensis]
MPYASADLSYHLQNAIGLRTVFNGTLEGGIDRLAFPSEEERVSRSCRDCRFAVRLPEVFMKFLLTSAGISNPSISDALVDLLGKPIAQSNALFIPTAIYPFPGGAGMAWKAICGKGPNPLCQLGWKSLGVLELTALPSIREENWVPAVREADALLVWGGDVLYLTYWMRQSGLADILPSLTETVYVGVSAGSIAMTPYNCDAEFDLQFVPDGSDMGQGADRALGLVDFTLYPHLNHPEMPDTTLANIEKWASGIPVPTYAIDDETAIKVVGGKTEVVSEGNWRLFTP